PAVFVPRGGPQAQAAAGGADELLPRHITPKTQDAIKKGLEYLKKTQGDDGNWPNTQDGTAYPTTTAALGGMAFLANGNTPSRGPYSDNVRKVMQYLMTNTQANGLLTGPGGEYGRPMHGHGFALLFLSSVYGMENDPKVQKQLKKVIDGAIDLTARGQ